MKKNRLFFSFIFLVIIIISMIPLTCYAEDAAQEIFSDGEYSLKIEPEIVSFGDLQYGYQTSSFSKTVSITNTGTSEIKLDTINSMYFTTSNSLGVILAPEKTIVVDIAPRMGFASGSYFEEISIADNNEISACIQVDFEVKAEEEEQYSLLSVVPFGTVTDIECGAVKNKKDLKLPEKALINTSGGLMSAQVKWDLEKCEYDPKIQEAQKFCVDGSVVLPENVLNLDDISLDIEIFVYVNGEDGRRLPVVSNSTSNMILGINSMETYTTDTKITFEAIGAGMDIETPVNGDVRYVPISWKISEKKYWENASYIATFRRGVEGEHTITVEFAEQKYKNHQWKDTGTTDLKTITFNIVLADQTSEPLVHEEPGTGDETQLLFWIIGILASAALIMGIVIVKKKKVK